MKMVAGEARKTFNILTIAHVSMEESVGKEASFYLVKQLKGGQEDTSSFLLVFNPFVNRSDDEDYEEDEDHEGIKKDRFRPETERYGKLPGWDREFSWAKIQITDWPDGLKSGQLEGTIDGTEVEKADKMHFYD